MPPWQNVVAVAGVIVAVGIELTVTVVADDVAEQVEVVFVTNTVKLPEALAVYEAAVDPVIFVPFSFHW